MPKKLSVVVIAVALVLAAVAPTLATTADPGEPALMAKVSFANKTAKRAKQIARQAKGIGQKANRKANEALNRVGAVEGEAAGLRTDVDAINSQLAAGEVKSATENSTVSTTEDTDYVGLGGPSLTTTVGKSGLIEVWAQVTIINEGAVSLYEDGQQMPNQAPNDVCDGPPGALLAHSLGDTFTLATPTGAPFLFCGSEGAPAPMLFETTPGQHTYELRYADCGCTPDGATFEARTLRVAARP